MAKLAAGLNPLKSQVNCLKLIKIFTEIWESTYFQSNKLIAKLTYQAALDGWLPPP
ncbi:hypothetical protein TUM17387_19000 [Shewanella carassii]|nr:hypothetical protein TUM17387_19000 [Shewanella carassii]